jgi:hypothetical protein
METQTHMLPSTKPTPFGGSKRGILKYTYEVRRWMLTAT